MRAILALLRGFKALFMFFEPLQGCGVQMREMTWMPLWCTSCRANRVIFWVNKVLDRLGNCFPPMGVYHN